MNAATTDTDAPAIATTATNATTSSQVRHVVCRNSARTNQQPEVSVQNPVISFQSPPQTPITDFYAVGQVNQNASTLSAPTAVAVNHIITIDDDDDDDGRKFDLLGGSADDCVVVHDPRDEDSASSTGNSSAGSRSSTSSSTLGRVPRPVSGAGPGESPLVVDRVVEIPSNPPRGKKRSHPAGREKSSKVASVDSRRQRCGYFSQLVNFCEV